MNTAKKGVRLIAETCHARGIRKVVFSPGSRSAPLVIAFSQMPDIECIVIPDERVAGYFALGMAQQLRETVAVVCTSGTAVLNLLPACCEASYQQVPLLFLTADRPVGADSIGENQAIEQEHIFDDYAYDQNIDADNDTGAEMIQVTEQAIYETQTNKTPARINIRLQEPLYDFTDKPVKIPKNDFQPEATGNTVQARIEAQENLAAQLADSNKKMIVIGLRNKDAKFSKTIAELAKRKDTVVLIESTSNCNVENAIYDFDSCIELLNDGNVKGFIPNIIVTLGNQIVSKKLKQLLRKYKPRFHWDVDQYAEYRNHDYFLLDAEDFPSITEQETLECLLEAEEKTASSYASEWADIVVRRNKVKAGYLDDAPFSDLKAIETIVRSFPANSNIQYGNSTPVRYSNFFEHKSSITANSNRGTSGIDGCVSTAAGAAYVNKNLTICMVGDVSFFYDSNSLWNNYLSPNFRVILINNSGGNIFRIIEGPGKVQDFEKFFETKHNLNASHLASMYNIPYYFSDRLETLEEVLPAFYAPQNGRPAVLEIKTNNETSAAVYKQYFEHLRNNR